MWKELCRCFRYRNAQTQGELELRARKQNITSPQEQNIVPQVRQLKKQNQAKRQFRHTRKSPQTHKSVQLPQTPCHSLNPHPRPLTPRSGPSSSKRRPSSYNTTISQWKQATPSTATACGTSPPQHVRLPSHLSPRTPH